MNRARLRNSRGDTAPMLLAYISLVALIAVGLLAVATLRSDGSPDWLKLSVLCALSILSFPSRGRGLTGKTTLSYASIIFLASAALVGPLGAAIVGAVSPLGGLKDQPPPKRVFNVSMNLIIAGLAGFVYEACKGVDLGMASGTPDLLLFVGLPLMVADVAM